MRNKIIALIISLIVVVGLVGYLNHEGAFDTTQASKTQNSSSTNIDNSSASNNSSSKTSKSTDSVSKKTSTADSTKDSGIASTNSTNKQTTETSSTADNSSLNNTSKTKSSVSFTSNNLTYDYFAKNIPYTEYTMVAGDTLTSISEKYSNTCTVNAALNLINSANNISDSKNLSIGTVVKIPVSTLKAGTLYKVAEGDTWGKIKNEYYPNIDIDKMTDFLVQLNSLPNNYLPLGEYVFLPTLN